MITVPKRANRSDGAGLGWWLWGQIVMLRCSNGHVARLDHTVASDGTVSPSVGCPHDGCGFHDHVQLERWNVSPPRQDTSPTKGDEE